MNKFAAIGLTEDALHSGKRVLVITHSARPYEMQELEAVAPEGAISRVVRANGRARIDYVNGGRVDFRSREQIERGGARGLSADVVFIDAGIDERVDDTIRFHRDLRLVVAASADGQVVRA